MVLAAPHSIFIIAQLWVLSNFHYDNYFDSWGFWKCISYLTNIWICSKIIMLLLWASCNLLNLKCYRRSTQISEMLNCGQNDNNNYKKSLIVTRSQFRLDTPNTKKENCAFEAIKLCCSQCFCYVNLFKYCAVCFTRSIFVNITWEFKIFNSLLYIPIVFFYRPFHYC